MQVKQQQHMTQIQVLTLSTSYPLLINIQSIWDFQQEIEVAIFNSLWPYGTKPLPEPMLTNHQRDLVALVWGQFHRK